MEDRPTDAGQAIQTVLDRFIRRVILSFITAVASSFLFGFTLGRILR